ncbi:hypothetical protein [Chitiniphilus shinanonensis]|uniref:hypothetical protein n=1 Tax=Chitiniphilus shinanonensis TaxID=553088 RepID=UPI003340032D
MDWLIVFFAVLFVVFGVSSEVFRKGRPELAHALQIYAVFSVVPAVIIDIVVSFYTGKALVRGATIDRASHPILFFFRVGLSFVAVFVAFYVLLLG